MKKLKQQIDLIFSELPYNTIDCFTKLYLYVAQHSENAPQLLQYVLECDCINTRNDVDPKLIEEQLSDRNRSDCRRMSSQVVKRLSNLNETEESFYSRLWDHLQSSCYIDDNERGYALLVISCNVRLPYHQLDKGIQMSDDQYGEITDRLYPHILRSIQILIRRKGLQRTQVASLLYQQLERLTNDDEKAVYLSHIISFLEKDNETPPKQEE